MIKVINKNIILMCSILTVCTINKVVGYRQLLIIWGFWVLETRDFSKICSISCYEKWQSSNHIAFMVFVRREREEGFVSCCLYKLNFKKVGCASFMEFTDKFQFNIVLDPLYKKRPQVTLDEIWINKTLYLQIY